MALRLEIEDNKFRVIGQEIQTKWVKDTASNRKVMVIALQNLTDKDGKQIFSYEELADVIEEKNIGKVKQYVEDFRESEQDFVQLLFRGRHIKQGLEIEKREEKFRVIGNEIETDWLPDTQANRKVILLALRYLKDRRGRNLFSYAELALIVGSEKRQTASQYCENFRACGEDFLSMINHKGKLDESVRNAVLEVMKKTPFASEEKMALEVNKILKRQDIERASVRCALSQISAVEMRPILKRLLEHDKIQYKEEALIDRLFKLIPVETDNPNGIMDINPESLECNASSTLKSHLEEVVKSKESTKLFEDRVVKQEELSEIWQSPIGWKLLAFILYFRGVSTSVIGGWFGVNKSTICRWLTSISSWSEEWVNKQNIQNIKFSGKIGIDEKWIKIDNCWWYLFAAIDCVTNYPLLVSIHPSNDGNYCKLFLTQLKLKGYYPKLIITDGWNAYIKAIPEVFPKAEHSLCQFHLLHSIYTRMRRLKLFDANISSSIGELFRTFYKRTVYRRIEKLKGMLEPTMIEPLLSGLFTKLPKAIKAVGNTKRPRTANCVEQFFSKFDRLYRLKGAFRDLDSAQKHVNLFMLGYLFSIKANGKACPLEIVGSNVVNVPFYHLFNQPNLFVLKQRIALQYENIA